MNSLIPNPEAFWAAQRSIDTGYGWIVILALMLSAFSFVVYKRFHLRFTPQIVGFHLPLWALGLLALAIRIPSMFDDFWYDETFTAAMVKLPLEKLPAAIMGDVHPPLAYLIEWLTARVFGTSEVALRLPSLVFGVLLVLLVYRLALVLFDSPTAFWAGLIVAVLPAPIFYSAEARGYALLACLVLGAVIGMSQGKAWTFFVCVALLPFTHNLGYVYLIVLTLTGLWIDHIHKRWILLPLSALALSLAWLPLMFYQAQAMSNSFWIPPVTIPGALWYIPNMTLSSGLPAALILPTYIPMLMLTVFALWQLRHWLKRPQGLIFLALVFGVPLAVTLASWLWRPVLITRALLPCALALVVLWAWMMSRYRVARWVMVPVFVAALLGYWTSGDKDNIRDALADCEGATSAFYTGLPAAFMGAYYVDLPYLLWPLANDTNQSLSAETKQAFGFTQGYASELSGTVCLVQVATPYSSQQEREYIASLLTHPHTTSRYEFNTLFHLYIYQLEL